MSGSLPEAGAAGAVEVAAVGVGVLGGGVGVAVSR